MAEVMKVADLMELGDEAKVSAFYILFYKTQRQYCLARGNVPPTLGRHQAMGGVVTAP